VAGAGKKVIGGRFAVEGTLGRGNYGIVHRARDLTSGREVALKLLREAQPDARRLERFRREAELVRGLARRRSSGPTSSPAAPPSSTSSS
jgi:serine/threonine protein kinase